MNQTPPDERPSIVADRSPAQRRRYALAARVAFPAGVVTVIALGFAEFGETAATRRTGAAWTAAAALVFLVAGTVAERNRPPRQPMRASDVWNGRRWQTWALLAILLGLVALIVVAVLTDPRAGTG